MKNYVSYDNAADLVEAIGDKIDEGGGGGGIEINIWVPKEWVGFNPLPSNIWTDGDNIYCSYDTSYQYVINVLNNTWNPVTWYDTSDNVVYPDGSMIWSDNDGNIYWTQQNKSYKYNKTTGKWDPYTWNIELILGNRVWKDGEHIYLSLLWSTYDEQYELINGLWTPKTWNGLTSFDRTNIWTDGTDIYYSKSSNQYVLDRATSTWLTKTWYGLSSVNGIYVWTDGKDTYYSNGANDQYILDKSSYTWNQITWNIDESIIRGSLIWNIFDDIYLSNGVNQYQLSKTSSDEIFFEKQVTLSTSDVTTVTFYSSEFKSSSVIEYECSKWGLIPDDIECVAGSCTVTMPKVTTAETVTIRIYVR